MAPFQDMPNELLDPLSMATPQKAVDSLSERTPGIDDTRYLALTR